MKKFTLRVLVLAFVVVGVQRANQWIIEDREAREKEQRDALACAIATGEDLSKQPLSVVHAHVALSNEEPEIRNGFAVVITTSLTWVSEIKEETKKLTDNISVSVYRNKSDAKLRREYITVYSTPSKKYQYEKE